MTAWRSRRPFHEMHFLFQVSNLGFLVFTPSISGFYPVYFRFLPRLFQVFTPSISGFYPVYFLFYLCVVRHFSDMQNLSKDVAKRFH